MPKKGTKKVTMEITWQVEVWVDKELAENDIVGMTEWIELENCNDEEMDIVEYVRTDCKII